MIRVYLDQNKWIDLARAATGSPHGARYADTLDAVRAAVAEGRASFPLDFYRYVETGKRQNDRSRIELADFMSEISRQHTLARPHQLLPSEVDLALDRLFGKSRVHGDVPAFGVGIGHILGGEASLPAFDPSRLPARARHYSADDLAGIARIHRTLMERELLRSGPEPLRRAGIDAAGEAFAQEYVAYENLIAASIRDGGLQGEMLELAVRASDLGGIQTVVVEALEAIGMSFDEFVERVQPHGVVAFVDDLPTRYVTNVMRAAKLRQSQQPWEANDLNDILALPVAAVYCDIVVTEKQWVHRLRQGKVGERFNTTLTSDVRDLVALLAHEESPPASDTL